MCRWKRRRSDFTDTLSSKHKQVDRVWYIFIALSVMYRLTLEPRPNHLMPMHNPPHPGETLLMDVLPELGISVTELARHLGFARPHLSRVLHGHAPISPDLAVRLERAGIGKARMWLGVQTDYDLWQAEHREQPAIERLAVHA